MKLQVLTWLRDSLVGLIGRTIETIFRIILCCLPLGVYLLLIQFRSKASTIRNISVYTEDNSVWQHIFPGFILVSINPNSLKEWHLKRKAKVQGWISDNRFLLFLLIFLVVFILTFAVFYIVLMMHNN